MDQATLLNSITTILEFISAVIGLAIIIKQLFKKD